MRGVFLDAVGERKLNQDAVDLGIGVEPGDLGEQFVLRGLGRQVELERLHADLDGLLGLVARVHLAGRVFAHQYDREAGSHAVIRFEHRDLLRHLLPRLAAKALPSMMRAVPVSALDSAISFSSHALLSPSLEFSQQGGRLSLDQ